MKSSYMLTGFTFIEVLLYIGLIGIILAALVPASLNIILGSTRNSVEQEVYSQAGFIAQKINSEIRDAIGINSISSNSISLETANGSTNPTVIELTGDTLFITQGAGDPTPLHSNRTSLSSVDFSDLSSGNSLNIGYSFTLAADYSGGGEAYTAEVALESAASVRSN